MMAANVISTLDAMRLCSEGKPKTFTFVSSTSVLDTDHYINLSDPDTSTGRQGTVLEDDDLQGSRTGLGTGYGQTKWVSEQLVRAAGARGLQGISYPTNTPSPFPIKTLQYQHQHAKGPANTPPFSHTTGSIIRPGYILGSTTTGVCNTDDFLIRMLKGCIQLSCLPSITNTVNAVPVTHVSRTVVAAALHSLPTGIHVIQITAHPRLRMNEFLAPLTDHGYPVHETSYATWKTELERHVSAGGAEKDQEQHALMPLYHFAVSDLPATTRAPELDDRNAVAVLRADEEWTGEEVSMGVGVRREDVGVYLAYLVGIGFLGGPPRGEGGRPLPEVGVGEGLLRVGRRG